MWPFYYLLGGLWTRNLGMVGPGQGSFMQWPTRVVGAGQAWLSLHMAVQRLHEGSVWASSHQGSLGAVWLPNEVSRV
jgi:hypothetical protein